MHKSVIDQLPWIGEVFEHPWLLHTIFFAGVVLLLGIYTGARIMAAQAATLTAKRSWHGRSQMTIVFVFVSIFMWAGTAARMAPA